MVAIELVTAVLGQARVDTLRREMAIDPRLLRSGADGANRADLALALGLLLFEGLLARVPSGRRYTDRAVAQGAQIVFDHGALRTILFGEGDTGALPGGRRAFARLLEPLGYARAKVYPLPGLRMTGHAYTQQDFPELLPQYFVSELHVEQFSEPFGAAARRVFGASVDPVGAADQAQLDALARGERLALDEARSLLETLVAALGCHHPAPSLADHALLRAESAEAAWIATEGNAFNHVTARVPDVDALADELRAEGFPIKDHVERSASGRVRQTALRADPVLRDFRGPDGEPVRQQVPGSFYEFISRDVDPATGTLDLSFDSGNAQGIFGMTRAA